MTDATTPRLIEALRHDAAHLVMLADFGDMGRKPDPTCRKRAAAKTAIQAADLLEADRDTIDRLTRENEALKETVHRVQAASRTLNSTNSEIYSGYVRASKINSEAVATLDSERAANAILTEENEALKAEVERLTIDGIHTCPPDCTRVACVLRRDLAEARAVIRNVSTCYSTWDAALAARTYLERNPDARP